MTDGDRLIEKDIMKATIFFWELETALYNFGVNSSSSDDFLTWIKMAAGLLLRLTCFSFWCSATCRANPEPMIPWLEKRNIQWLLILLILSMSRGTRGLRCASPISPKNSIFLNIPIFDWQHIISQPTNYFSTSVLNVVAACFLLWNHERYLPLA